MKNEKLQASEALAKHFAPYREEAPLISAPEIKKLLAERAMLPNPSRINVRRIIMTLSGITGLAVASYFAFFTLSHVTNGTLGTHTTRAFQTTHSSHFAQATNELSQLAKPTNLPAKNATQLHAKPAPRGPWSAAGDQIYADLTRKELARLGITVVGDTVITYKLPPNDTVESIKLTMHSIGNMRRTLPAGVHALRSFPVLMTLGSGHAAAYVIEKNGRTKEWGMAWGSAGDNAMDMIRKWLESPGVPGLIPVWWNSKSIRKCNTCPEIDSMTLKVGKNLAKPILPFYTPNDQFSDSVKVAIAQLVNYYCGKASKPNFNWPKNLFINADTVTAKDLLAEVNSEENHATMQHLRSIMSRLNELIPVIVRMKPATGAPGPNDFIFWYEPSKELFNALPPVQAAVFRAKLNESPHCFTAPNAVLTSAEVTYCVAAPQVVHITVSDLTGRALLRWDESAVAGDNVSKFSTAILASGMYLVTVKSADGTERTRRIWVENAHPKKLIIKKDLDSSISETITVENGEKSPDPDTALEQPSLLTIPSITLDAASLAKIGVESNDMLAAFYTTESNPNKALYMGILRSWGAIPRSVERSEITNITIPTFIPTFVTDGRGCKRLFGSSADHYDSAEDRKAFEAIDQLIPILLHADNSSDSIGARDLIFWYQPTPEFLAALPDSARAIAEAIINGSGNGNESVAAMHGAIQQAMAYPNPSRGRFTLKLSVKGERSLTFTLRNLLGQPVAPPTEARVKGESEQPLDFGTIPEGVYLLDITSSHGERYLQRIVIAR